MQRYKILVAFFCVFSVLIPPLPHSYADDITTQLIRQLDLLPAEMQMEVLLNLMPLVKQRLETKESTPLGEICDRKLDEWTDCRIENIVSFSPGGWKVATACYDKPLIKLWSVRTGKVLHYLKGHGKGVTAIALSEDGSKLASASLDKTVKIWDTQTGRVLYTLKGYKDSYMSVCFSADGSKVALGSQCHKLKIWDVKTRKLLRTLKGYNNGSSGRISICFSPDGSKIVSGVKDSKVITRDALVWNIQTDKVLHKLKDVVGPVCFSSDGLKMASVVLGRELGNFSGIHIWDVRTGKVLHTIKSHSGDVDAICFSPGGSMVVSGEAAYLQNTKIKIWDIRTGTLLKNLEAPWHHWRSILSSRYGSKLTLISLKHGKTSIRIWNFCDLRKAVEELMNRVNQLDPAQLLLIYVLSLYPEGIHLSNTEKALKMKYGKKKQEVPRLLNLKESYDTLSPELKKLVHQVFKVAA